MKYLKKFNEEYSSQTYGKISRNLLKKANDLPTSTFRERSIKSNLEKRAKNIKDHSIFIEKIENLNKWKEQLLENSPFGMFNLTIENVETGETLSGEFALSIEFDELAFMDEPENGIGLFVGIIPSSKELALEYMDKFPDSDMGNGFIWSMIVSLKYEISDDKVIMKSFEITDYDSDSNGGAIFSDKESAEKFKTLLKDIFGNKQLGYPSGYTDAVDIYDKLESCILHTTDSKNNTFGSDYNFKLQNISDFISKLNVKNDIGYLQ